MKVNTYGYINCEDCGQLVLKKHPMTKRCPECQREHNKQEQRKYHKKRSKTNVKPVSQCKKTKTCIYGSTMSHIDICNYLEMVGHSRGCPVKGCTKYKRRKKK